jgi:HTH-type transcriptional regulator / antitoxin HigA
MAAEPLIQRDWGVPPGEVLLEALEERDMSQSELARRMGRPTKTINEIVHGKAAITPETAIQLELSLGITASFWNNLETSYRAHLARMNLAQELERQASWAGQFPLKDLAKHGLVAGGKSKGATVAELLAYFGVSSPKAWETHWGRPMAAFRASPAYGSSPQALAAWLRWGEILASQRTDLHPFEPRRLREVLSEARPLSRKDVALTVGRLEALMKTAGVALVLTPEFSGIHLSGAARWLSSERAVIQLSLRHKSDDHFWFSLFHEAGHLLGPRRADFVDAPEHGQDSSDEEELRADRFARDQLIPSGRYGEFVAAGYFDTQSVKEFARAIAIAPGIVVGRLQRDRHLDKSQLNGLKKPIRWAS